MKKKTYYGILGSSIITILGLLIFQQNQKTAEKPFLAPAPGFHAKQTKKTAESNSKSKVISVNSESEMSLDEFKNDLNRYLELHAIALPRNVELQELRKLESDPNILDQATSVLLNTSEEAYSQTSEKTRLQAIHYLKSALKWKENPIRTQVTQEVLRIVTTNNINTHLPKRVKKSIIGDKVELFNLLAKEEPHPLVNAVQTTEDPQLLKIYLYASQMGTNNGAN